MTQHVSYSGRGVFADDVNTDRRDTVVLVRWALIIACAYLVLFSDGATHASAIGPVTIVLFLASNLVVGRLRPEVVATQQFAIAIAVLDSVLIAVSLFVAGQLMVELVVLFLGVLILAIAGLRMSVVAASTIAMSVVYVLLVWALGGESIVRSSMLLRVPFLLCAAMAYAWIREAGGARQRAADGSLADAEQVAGALTQQHEAVERCRAALANGANGAALAALDEIAARSEQLRLMLAGVETGRTDSRETARSAA